MMIRTLSATGFILTLTLMPLSAAAYVTPEETLDDDTYTTRFYDPPPSTRTTSERMTEQQRVSAQRRQAEYDAANPPPTTKDEAMHGAAPEEEQSDIDKMIELVKLLQSNEQSTQSVSEDTARASLDPVSQRLLIRAEAQSTAAERAALIQSLTAGNGEPLHGGAPLAGTGPATALIAVVTVGAIAETWRRVRKTQAPEQH